MRMPRGSLAQRVRAELINVDELVACDYTSVLASRLLAKCGIEYSIVTPFYLRREEGKIEALYPRLTRRGLIKPVARQGGRVFFEALVVDVEKLAECLANGVQLRWCGRLLRFEPVSITTLECPPAKPPLKLIFASPLVLRKPPTPRAILGDAFSDIGAMPETAEMLFSQTYSALATIRPVTAVYQGELIEGYVGYVKLMPAAKLDEQARRLIEEAVCRLVERGAGSLRAIGFGVVWVEAQTST